MKDFDGQLADHYAAFDAGTLEPWEVQYQRAVESGRPWRDVRDFIMGFGKNPENPNQGRVVIYLTDEEIAQAAIDTANEITARQAPPTKEQLQAELQVLTAKIAAL